MSAGRKALTSDDWLLEQQVRAEVEAEAWRRLREALAQPAPALAPAPAATPAPPQATAIERLDQGGSIILKALVRFAMAAFGAYLAWIAAMDGGLGEFEIWLATGTGFIVTLCLTMFEPVRRFVRLAADTLRWALLGAAAVGAFWLIAQAAP